MIIEKREVTFYLLKYLLYSFSRILSDKLFLQLKFRLFMDYPLDLEHPKTFNEKLQWLKLYDRKPEYSKMVDKVEAKEYVANIIGEEHIIPTLGIYDKPEDIDFESLPDQFVLKTTHDSGGVFICRDKSTFDIDSTIRKIKKRLKRNIFWYNREWPYKNVKPRIIAEEYLVDESGYELKDYKFFCFNGAPKYVQLDFDRFKSHKRNIYDLNWNFMDLQIEYPNAPKYTVTEPHNFLNMKQIASMLSKGMSHVRVDLYNVNGKIYFGELTFFHGSGFEHFSPEKWDYTFGELIELPNNI